MYVVPCSSSHLSSIVKQHKYCFADEVSQFSQIHGKTELVTSTRRPVPLTWYFSTKHSLLPLLDEKGINVNR